MRSITKVDGGYAFPITHLCYKDEDGTKAVSGSGGMSLRDYFAAQALAASDWANWDLGWPEKGEEIADRCYRLAECMIAERSNRRRK